MVFLSRILYRNISTQTRKLPSIQPLFDEQDLPTFIEKFKTSSETKYFRGRQSIYNYMVRRLAWAKKFSDIEDILEEHKKYKDIANEGFALRIISLYGKAGMFDHAYKTFEQLPELNCDRTVKSFNGLLKACLECKKYDEAVEIFGEYPKKLSITPDSMSYSNVMRAYCEMGQFDSAVSMLDEMEKNGVKPDLIPFNMLLNVFYGDGDRFSDGEEIWVRMEKSGLGFDIRSYNARLRGLVCVGRLPEAARIVEELEESSTLTPDEYSYNALIEGYCIDGNLDEAKKIYDDTLSRKLVDGHTFNVLVPCACQKGELDMALAICNDGLERNFYFKADYVQVVVDGLVKESRVEEAEDLVELAKSKNYAFSSLEVPSGLE
ncbi:hypothetical protein GIB67_000019 [Kingdonia uniflora]|uniref:Pentatricopeptide repeat-containing protein n=1 Tax=Kingdonia uniflora TaxID=39325 RepID=A0A7J7MNZ4_9MAGN|nr:hypothetical protein GIB67_000019 [Kingdonia uniflora]